MTDIRDIKGVVPVPIGWWPLWLALALIVVIGIVIWLWKRKQPRDAQPTVRPLSPFEVALRALQKLRDDNPLVEEFYTRLSDIVRHYLENRFQLRAPERTTEEFLYEVSRDGTLSAAHKELLGAFLQECDLVKFARYEPAAADRQRAFAAAQKFVEESEQKQTVGTTVNAR